MQLSWGGVQSALYSAFSLLTGLYHDRQRPETLLVKENAARVGRYHLYAPWRGKELKMLQSLPEVPLYTNIQRLCEEKHLSIAALERKAGIGNGVIRKWNKASPTLRTLMAVAACLGVTLEELMNP